MNTHSSCAQRGAGERPTRDLGHCEINHSLSLGRLADVNSDCLYLLKHCHFEWRSVLLCGSEVCRFEMCVLGFCSVRDRIHIHPGGSH